MNFRSCKYFLTVCEMGTISAAARKLYVSQQSLSHHIRHMEEEIGAQLFYRDNPLVLTEEGKCVQWAAQSVLAIMDQMDKKIAVCKGTVPHQLIIGLLDYGTPEFLPSIVDLFLRKNPDVTLQTRELASGDPLPDDIPLFICARELGRGYKSEVVIVDRLGICVSDDLLKKVYGAQWEAHKKGLLDGDLSALAGCPFLQNRRMPLQRLETMAFQNNGFTPTYLRIMTNTSAFTRMCAEGKGAMVTFMGHAQKDRDTPACYPIPNTPERISAGFICYRTNEVLSPPAQQFLKITRRYFQQSGDNATQ